MTRNSTRFLIALVSAASVMLVAVSDMGRTSPGALSAVHGREDELTGRSDCSACHGGFFTTLSEACLECHEAIRTQVAAGEGLHGVLGARVEQCGLCHAEHHGSGSALVHRQSFALAGVPRLEEFDHRRIGFPMDGAHLPLECVACHENARVAVLPAGERRYLGLDQDCASCHEDAHEGRMELACASCHGQETWDGLHSEDHERFLPLIGGHGGLACLECHAEEGTHGLERLGGRGSKPSARACLDCHASPHAAGFVGGAALSAALSEPAACVTCHAAEHESFRDERLELSDGEHAFSGFPLEPPHAGLACEECHAPQGEFAARHPGRRAEACSTCHEDPHGGQFEEGPFAGQECTACHVPQHFEPHAFTVETHALAELPLEGSHLELECAGCHVDPVADEPRLFHGTPSDCADCHEDAHAGFFTRFTDGTTGMRAPRNGECARCHDAQSFTRVSSARFEHGRWTAFPLDGAHEQATCESCHPRSGEPDSSHRTFGRVSEHFGPFEGCVTCHADPHLSAFDGAGQPPEVEGRAGCARCHSESSFRALPRGFDHGSWTGFALFEEHGAVGCTGCHAPLANPDELGRTWEHALGSACSACHSDPHAGQFQEDGTGCERCHDDAARRFLTFDHERDSRFPLREAHRDVDCAACHARGLVQGLEVVRYRPLPTECVDCHGAQEEVLLRKKPRRRT